MGAQVKVEGNSATIEGVERFSAARVSAPDLAREQRFALRVLRRKALRSWMISFIFREDMSGLKRNLEGSAL